MPFIFTKAWLASAPNVSPANSATAQAHCPGFARFIWRINADWPEPYGKMHETPRIAGIAALQRRRTQMPCLRFAAPLVLAFALAAAPAVAQPRPPAGAPSPLQPGDAFGEDVTMPERTIVY